MTTTTEQDVPEGEKKKKDGVWETVKIIIQALLLAVIVTTLVFRLFSIPSASMRATLLEGDYVFVTKYAYGYSRYSLPFGIDLFDGRIFGNQPERGDVVVFKWPADNRTDYIKRVIGLPGDRVQMINGVVYLNGEAIPREQVGTVEMPDRYGNTITVPQYRETLPSGVSYLTLDQAPNYFYDTTEEFIVPEGTYFMLGDNRDDSADSRVSVRDGGVGFVPFENLVGRAEFIIFSIEDARPWEIWKWPSAIRWDRFFDGL